MMPIYEGGDENDAGNCRGVALLNTGYKLAANAMASKISRWTEEKKTYLDRVRRRSEVKAAHEIIFLY